MDRNGTVRPFPIDRNSGSDMAAKANSKGETTETREEAGDGPLMDGFSAAVKKMFARAKERGYITYDELNAALPQTEMSSEQIEDVMANLNEMGINLVDGEEPEEGAAATAEKPAAAAAGEAANEEEEERSGGNLDDADIGRTDDPVRMYLREMGSVELLSREGEIAIAKRIEAGRDMMIGGLCESPLTFKAIISWHDQLKAGRMLLRDIIDLEATQGAGTPAVDGVPTETNGSGGNGAAEPMDGADDMDGDEDGEGPGISLSAL